MEAGKAKAAVQIANVYIERCPDNPVLLTARDTAMESEVLALVQAGKAKEAVEIADAYLGCWPENSKLVASRASAVAKVRALVHLSFSSAQSTTLEVCQPR